MLACVFQEASKMKCKVACISDIEYLPHDPISSMWSLALHPELRKVLASYFDLLGSLWEQAF